MYKFCNIQTSLCINFVICNFEMIKFVTEPDFARFGSDIAQALKFG
jgi:hypothetical protein